MSKQIVEYLSNFIPKEHSWKITLLQNWEKIIGDLKGKVIIDRIKGSILLVGVTHPAWAQELQLLFPTLKDKINLYLGQEYIKNIRFKVFNPRKKVNKKQFIKGSIYTDNLLRVELLKTERIILNEIADKSLRDVLREFLLQCKRVKRRSGE